MTYYSVYLETEIPRDETLEGEKSLDWTDESRVLPSSQIR